MQTAAPDSREAAPAAASGAAVVTAEHVTKEFPGVVAVDNLSLSIAPGEIVALLGQNGAGKSTFIQILAGVHRAGTWRGEITLAGAPYRPASVAEAEAAGVALVPQEVNVAPDMTVAENMYLNAEPTRWGFLDQPLRLARARRVLADFGLEVDPAAPMGSLDLSTQQLVIIARALSKNARLLILDEPTAALTEAEARRLFDRMRALTSRGVAIIFVSHRLAEVFAISDRIVIMRDGRVCGMHATADVSRDIVVAQMVGGVRAGVTDAGGEPGATALEATGLTVTDQNGRVRVAGASFRVAHGEVIGLFGLLGAGCVETALALYGAWPGRVGGSIALDGRTVAIADPTVAVAHGMGLMAQDRRDCLLPDHSVHDNAMLASLDAVSRGGVLDLAAAQRKTTDFMRHLDIKAGSIEALVGTLSGGNQQKVQVARWLIADARILILVDPTRGVDVGARAEIKRVWSTLRADGRAIVIASTDAEELVGICDRVLVFRQGRIAGELPRAELSEERLLRMAADV